MSKSYKSAGLLVDEIELQALHLRNKIMQYGFAREMNHLVQEEARCCCEGCRGIDDLSQLHHDHSFKPK